MRILGTSTVLGTTLVALAILNFSVLDQIGIGLVEGVEAKFTELGADWIGLQLLSNSIDPGTLATELATIEGVRSTLAYWSTMQPSAGADGAMAVHEWIMPAQGYDLASVPYLFVFQEDTATQAKFYRDQVVFVEGSPPGPGDVAISTTYAADTGLQPGATLRQTFGALAGPFGGGAPYNASYVVSGIYERAFSDPDGQPVDAIVVGPDPQLRAALQSGLRGFAARNVTILQASLPTILAVSDAVLDQMESNGYNVSTEAFQIGGRTFVGRIGAPPGGGGPGGGGGPAAGGGGPPGQGGAFTPPDAMLYANGEVLAQSLDAAENAGSWYRFLTLSAVLLALVGIGFVTAAMEKKVRRDVGIRQAVGYPIGRIYGHWALVAVTMGLIGSLVGVGAVAALSAAGLSRWALGLDLAFDFGWGVALAPIAAVLVYGLATFPTYRRVLRATPAENLRAVAE